MNKIYYKGFNQDFTCRKFQFEVGKTYKHDGKVKACESGFHSCENPLDVLDYYPLVDGRFAVVEVGGDISRGGDDTKIASSDLTIKTELNLSAFVDSCIAWLQDHCAQNASSGDYTQNASSGFSTKNASSGDYTQNASSGGYAQNASSGDYTQNASSGYRTKNASSGYRTKNAVMGESSVSVDAGICGRAKAGKNGAIALTRWVGVENRYRISVGYVGEDLKEGVWYTLDGYGNFVEV